MNVFNSIKKGRTALLRKQNIDSYWQFPLESDCTMPVEYILLQHFLGQPVKHENELTQYLINHQNTDGGWPLYDGGKSDLSCSVKSYYALKCSQTCDPAVLEKAKYFILANGGAEQSNVFTRILLALFKQLPWDSVPWQPVELILLPKWFPFNIYKISYWSRAVMLPLAVLVSNKAEAKNPLNINVSELFIRDPWTTPHELTTSGIRSKIILKVEQFCRKHIANHISKTQHTTAINEISNWILERANYSEGLGGILPAMAGLLMSLPYLNLTAEDKNKIELSTNSAIENLIVQTTNKTFVQPCISPVWDTAIATLALIESNTDYDPMTTASIYNAISWLTSKQIKITGDWIHSATINKNLQFNGWAFQNYNDHYPDVDDTAMVLLALHSANSGQFHQTCASTWLTTMQSKNGGYGAFDANNDTKWINDIPFADHKCMLDPPTADVSGRVLAAIFNSEKNTSYYSREKLINYLLKEQESNGLWWGRWGTNYLWGTWSAIMGLKHCTSDKVTLALNKTAEQLLQLPHTNFGYGESNQSYETGSIVMDSANAFHTALVLLILCDLYGRTYYSYEINALADKVANWLVRHQLEDGSWETKKHNAPGFPKVFYLKYYGYSYYFPLWALARYQKTFT